MNTPVSKSKHVVVIGGGITGLSSAWYLLRQAREQTLDLRVSILECTGRWGGKIVTEEVQGYGTEPLVVEAGPDSFLTQKPWALQLARELGLEHRLLNTNDHMRKVFVLSRGKPTPLPDGVMMIVPTRLMPFALSPLLSPLAKLRMGMDVFLPAKRDGEDETIAEFILRRLGSEALDKIAEPLMSGIYNAEADKQSLLATFPRFRALEVEHGSLIRGMLASRKAHTNPNGGGQTSKKPSMFSSLIGGMRELVDTLVAQLGDSVHMRTSANIDQITRRPENRYRIALQDGTSLEADAVVVTTPAYVAAALVRELAPEASKGLELIRYVSTGTVSLAYRRSEIQHPLDGFGLVIPRSECRPINAITWSSTKFDHRAPEGYALLRVFFGGSRHPEMMAKPDDELLPVVQAELASLMSISARPVFERIFRWFNANPQYDKGHIQHVDAIEAALPEGLFVTGSAYRGIGIPDCVHQAQETAQKVFDTLRERMNA